MHAAPPPAHASNATIPQLAFAVAGVRALEHVAVPTIAFSLAVESVRGHEVRSVLLDVQLQIAARRRPYEEREQEALADLFGTPDRWGSTLGTLPWLRTTAVIPAFCGRTVVELPVVCTYDLVVKASRYLNALAGGTVPLELLFSGTVFFAGEGGALQTAMIGWDTEAECDMPVATWKEAIDHHFPGSAWLRLDRDSFDRLTAYRTRRQLGSWEETLGSLLPPEAG
jgi:hypothetical protein